MTELEAKGRRVSLTRSQLRASVGAELLSLCQTITEDGSISEQEVSALRTWLDENRSADLPSLSFLVTTVERIIADGRISKEECKELYKAVESVLPMEARKDAVARRRRVEADEKHRARDEKEAVKQREREERKRSRPVASLNFMVAGVRYEGRPEVIRDCPNEDDEVYLVRDKGNRFSSNAIEVRLSSGLQIGFVPELNASEFVPLLDKGCLQEAFITKILTGGRFPIPVVQAYFYRPDARVEGAIASDQIPSEPDARVEGAIASDQIPAGPAPQSKTGIVFIIFMILLALIMYFFR